MLPFFTLDPRDRFVTKEQKKNITCRFARQIFFPGEKTAAEEVKHEKSSGAMADQPGEPTCA
jgi:hypothetical protein